LMGSAGSNSMRGRLEGCMLVGTDAISLPGTSMTIELEEMNPVSKLLARVPERTLRAPSGSPLRLPSDVAAQDGRLAYLAQHLNWLTPFHPLDHEGQRILGLLAARDRVDRDDEESEAEEDSLSRVGRG
jgi:hypothetical protein